MAKFEQRDGDISIFKNDRKTKDTHPDYQGTFLLDGVKYDVALWDKHSTRGSFQAGKVKVQEYRNPGDARETQRPNPTQNTFGAKNPHAPRTHEEANARYKAQQSRDFEDEIPF